MKTGSEDKGKITEFLERRRAVLLSDGDTVIMTANKSQNARLCFIFRGTTSRTHRMGGPIVHEYSEELDLAFRELDENTFIKHS